MVLFRCRFSLPGSAGSLRPGSVHDTLALRRIISALDMGIFPASNKTTDELQ